MTSLPEPPYYAVIFSAQQSDDIEGYGPMADTMIELAAQQSGYLGIENTRGADGFGITISYWKSEADIAAWKENVRHQAAQKAGMERWYSSYTLRVAKVERAYTGPAGRGEFGAAGN
ncbi:MAG: antibiotic biosynthesis monooxygenase family protein [Hyphomicrobiales bacterium]